MTIDDVYVERFASSAALQRRAEHVLAGGATHDSWQFDPHPVFMDRSEGPWKWDVSGRHFVDFWMGHGALLCGHGFPQVVEAVTRQAARACHLGGAHELQVAWAEEVSRLIPSAERVRFTASGTEGTLLAIRVARAYTGRPIVVKFDGHFHGWHDEALCHFVSDAAGLNRGVGEYVRVASPLSVDGAIELASDDDVAAVLLEPGGGASGGLPWDREMLAALREITQSSGALLVFDEVVSGFRYSPGGVQALCGVVPDLTVLAKILCGGLAGGAVVGRADVMAVFGRGVTRASGQVRVPHTGTLNANPLSAAAGVAMLRAVADGVHQHAAEVAARRLAEGVNRAAKEADVDVRLFASSSIFHILIGAVAAGAAIGPSAAVLVLQRTHWERYAALRRALLVEGVDCHPVHGWVSSAHDDATIEFATAAFARSFVRLRGTPAFAGA